MRPKITTLLSCGVIVEPILIDASPVQAAGFSNLIEALLGGEGHEVPLLSKGALAGRSESRDFLGG
jgi:hypothetical protein